MTDTEGSVPFLDLASVNAVARRIRARVEDGAAPRQFVGGPEVELFEAGFAAYCDATSCVGVANGTDALELILTGLGIGQGAEVIVPANTFVATAEAVCAVGARPRFVDVLPDTLLIDADAVAAAAPATAAVIAVHLFGQMADLDGLTAVCRRHGLAVIEDASQAHGARLRGRRAGSVGVAAAFSFYPGKNLGALGDAGAVVTGDTKLADMDAERQSRSDRGGPTPPRSARMQQPLDTLQAAMLITEARRPRRANLARQRAMDRYRRQFLPRFRPIATHPIAESVHHLAVICAESCRGDRELERSNRVGNSLSDSVSPSAGVRRIRRVATGGRACSEGDSVPADVSDD